MIHTKSFFMSVLIMVTFHEMLGFLLTTLSFAVVIHNIKKQIEDHHDGDIKAYLKSFTVLKKKSLVIEEPKENQTPEKQNGDSNK